MVGHASGRGSNKTHNKKRNGNIMTHIQDNIYYKRNLTRNSNLTTFNMKQHLNTNKILNTNIIFITCETTFRSEHN